jgi:hypothetical protein
MEGCRTWRPGESAMPDMVHSVDVERRREKGSLTVSVMLGWASRWTWATVRGREGSWAAPGWPPAGLDLGGFGFRLG